MVDLNNLYKKAEDAFNKGNFDYAIDLLSQILLINQNFKDARIALKTALSRKYEKIGYPSKIKLGFLYQAATTQLQLQKNPQKKIEIIQKYLMSDPNNSKMRVKLAQILREAGFIDGAVAEAQLAVECDKKNAEAYKILGELYKQLDMIKEAQEAFAMAMRLNPEDRKTEKIIRDLAAVATMRKGIEEAKSYRDILKDKEKAEELEKAHHLIKTEDELQAEINQLLETIQRDQSDVKSIRKLAELYTEVKKDYVNGAKWWKRASELVPQDSTFRDKYEDCIIKQFAQQIAEAQKNNNPQLLQELKVKKLTYELKSYERRVAERPTDTEARFELGKRYYSAGPNYLDKAIKEFQQSVKDPKRRVDSHIYLGICFQKKGLFDLAEEQYAKAEEAGLVTQEKQLYIWYNRALCLSEAGNKKGAIEFGKKIMQIDIGYRDISELVSKWQQELK